MSASADGDWSIFAYDSRKIAGFAASVNYIPDIAWTTTPSRS